MKLNCIYCSIITAAMILLSSCSDYPALAVEHKNLCKNHQGREVSIHRDGQWQVFCNDDYVVIVDD